MNIVSHHIDAALAGLPSDEEFDRLLNPRHTDHDRHVFLPTKLAQDLAAVRRELEAALYEVRSLTAPAVPEQESDS